MTKRTALWAGILALAATALANLPAAAQQPNFNAPPHSVTDITAILDAEKPDPALIAELKSTADAAPPISVSGLDLAQFYYDRGNARKQLGRMQEALQDGQKAVDTARDVADSNLLGRMTQFLGLQYGLVGEPKQAMAVFERMVRDVDQPGSQGFLFNIYKQMGSLLLQIGDLSQADDYLRRGQQLLREARDSPKPGWRNGYLAKGASWEADVEYLRAMISEARGQFGDAEKSYQLAEERKRASLNGILSSVNPPPEDQITQSADVALTSLARMKARQGRLGEAEVDARRALLSRLQHGGKYNPDTPRYITVLANILIEEGRYRDSEKLTRTALEINHALGMPEDAPTTAQLLSQLGSILLLEELPKEAAEAYTDLDKTIATWEPARRAPFELNSSRINSLFLSDQIEIGIAAAEALIKREVGRVGAKHIDTAMARGTLALGLAKVGREAEALREFRAAVPLLISGSRESADDDDTALTAARNTRLQTIVETYIGLLARVQRDNPEAAVETFPLADSIRGHSVQAALAASSTRTVAQDPILGELVRKEQDLSKQINAQLGMLNNALSLPSTERDEKAIAALNADIVRFRADRDTALQDINKRFPSYADLVDPHPPSVQEIKQSLRSDEALLSFYFGKSGSFVWTVRRDGPTQFSAISITSTELDAKIRKLREALEPQAAMISDIPAFDLALGYELYSVLLKPVEAGWKPAKNLIVVTNGALGLLPLSLLPTEPANVADGEPMFASYKKVPWLARTHAVTVVPSAAALRTLRSLPPGKPDRETFIAFGDPLFSKEQASEAETSMPIADASIVMRGLPLQRRSAPQFDGIGNAELAMLPRLPDTADELRSIASALNADPSKALNLEKAANERAVKSLDLSHFKILAFATHGLVPGELDGLTQPALALSAPDTPSEEDDGLLTMNEILTLKLDADWVILSACNTGTGAGAGAEAASGLGRAFFYAGTRALLVTNWSVHSASARRLISDLFSRQEKNLKITRGEALREAMVALIDGEGYTDETGKTQFSYAHPLFWAPYTIIGDGG